MRREGSLLALLEGEGKGRGSSQIPRRQRNRGERGVLETPATRKALAGEPGGAEPTAEPLCRLPLKELLLRTSAGLV